jgi:hypothetical protein
MPVEVYQHGQSWLARIEGVERLLLTHEARVEREQLGLGPPLGFMLQPQKPQIEVNALILEPGTIEHDPLWKEVTSLEDAQTLIALEMKDNW